MPKKAILVILDDVDRQVMKAVPTPTLDALAAGGCVYTDALAASSLCGSSRAALLTGLWPHQTGVRDHSAPHHGQVQLLDPYPGDFIYALNQAGIKTYNSRKGAFHGGPGSNQPGTWTDSGGGGSDWTEATIEGSVAGIDWGYYPLGTDRHHLLEERALDWAIDAITADPDEDALLCWGPTPCHIGYRAPEELRLNPRADVQFGTPGDLYDVPAAGRAMSDDRYAALVDAEKAGLPGLTSATQAYCAAMRWNDELLGRLASAITAAGLWDRVLLIVTSDHGYGLGWRDDWGKSNLSIHALRVPLILFGYGVDPGTVAETTVSLPDVGKTILDYFGTGMAAPPAIYGQRRWRPLPTVDVPGGESFALLSGSAGAENVTCRNRGWAFTRYADGSQELYSRVADSNEERNLAGNAWFDAVRALREQRVDAFLSNDDT